MRSPRQPSMAMRFIEAYREYIVFFVVLPISLVLRVVHAWDRRWNRPDASQHEARVQRVQSAVRQKRNQLMTTDRSACASHSPRIVDKRRRSRIKMSDVRAILSLEAADDGQSAFVRAEPGVTIAEITRFLISKGFLLQCTLEMENATIGGVANGTGVTTQSHRAGVFHDIIVSWEVVVASGECIVATATNEHADLFRALPFSHGSLGLCVALTLRCIPARRYVHVTYTPFDSVDGFAAAFRAKTSTDGSAAPDFVEGSIHSPRDATLMTGVLRDELGGAPLNRQGLWWKPWFFSRAGAVLAAAHAARARGDARPLHEHTRTEAIPLYDYLFRHHRSMCHTMKTVMPFGNAAWFRCALHGRTCAAPCGAAPAECRDRYPLGWLLPPDVGFLKASHIDETREASVRKQVFQDLAFPVERLGEAVGLSARLFDIFPVLCYPLAMRDVPGRLVRSSPRGCDAPFANLGIYGVPAPILRGDRAFKTIHAVRELEAWLASAGGFQHSYCDSFLARDEFERMFDTAHYEAVRRKYGADGAFVHTFEKTRPEVDVWAWLEEEKGWA
jgi:delta24-sterol reductase